MGIIGHRRIWLVSAGLAVLVYAVSVLVYVQSVPDLGLKSLFDTAIKGTPELRVAAGELEPQQGDKVQRIGNKEIKSWPDLLKAPAQLQKKLSRARQQDIAVIEANDAAIANEIRRRKGDKPHTIADWAVRVRDGNREYFLIRAEFEGAKGSPHEGKTMVAWCKLDGLPTSQLVPSVIWFLLKLLLFVVGVVVLWKKPNDPASVLFFILCIVTIGAYMGGYHWPYINTDVPLLVGFIVCAVLLPAVTLHFYLVFPKPKRILSTKPRRTLVAVYALPSIFLSLILFQYWRLRTLYNNDWPAASVQQACDFLVKVILIYLMFGTMYYLSSIAALLHSYRSSRDATQRNQVKCILFGVVTAAFPIGYTLYLLLFDFNKFGAGGATWPMFAASFFITAAFVVSITRYRLMELDRLLSSGATYFLISFLIGAAYYAVVFLGALLFNQVVASPPLSEALRVSTVALVLLLALDAARTRFKKALDRRFHREKYHLDRTLQRMGEAVQNLVDAPTLVQRLLYASADLLGVTRGAVYLRQGDSADYRLAGWVGPAPAPVELPPSSPLVTALQESGSIAHERGNEHTPPALEQLQAVNGEVAQALSHNGQLLAFLVLGPKANGTYRQDDINLLAAFAQITVLALGNARGHRTIEFMNQEVQEKIAKIAEQQRRIFALQTQLRRLDRDRVAPNEASSNPSTQSAGQTGRGQVPVDASWPSGDDEQAFFADRIVGAGSRVRRLLQMVRKVAQTDSVVLIRGESGTGKELLAEAVHQASPRADKPFVKVHCAALSATLLESELFGHVKGAFTGAHRDKVGRFEMANGGTMFLDEIGDISLEVQTKLLRVLQEKVIERVGSSEPAKVDVRIIAATHQNLEDLIRQERFREDLYYRLNVFPINVPPLRERKEDIAELVMHFLEVAGSQCGKPGLTIDDDALSLLKAYHWPGNIRQLENVIERAVVLVEGTSISVDELPIELSDAARLDNVRSRSNGYPSEESPDLQAFPLVKSEREQFERDQILRAVERAGGNKAQAARTLGLARSTLVSRLKKYGLL